MKKYKNQIDFVLLNSRFKNDVRNIRTLRGADLDLDHLPTCWDMDESKI